MEALSTADRNKLALKYGLILAAISIVLSTIASMTVNVSAVYYGIFTIVNFVLFVIVLGLLAKSVRKANGGYIEFKEMFGAVFVILLVASVLGYIYHYIYTSYIDPDFNQKIIDATKEQMSKFAAGSDELEEALDKIDSEEVKAPKFSILEMLQSLLFNSLFGLIVAAIVKKAKPVFE